MKLTTTYQYRIKDNNKALSKALFLISGKVNFIWNYVNNLQQQSLIKYNSGMNTSKKWLSAFDLQAYTSGVSKTIKLPAQTIQSVNEEYAKKRIQFKKPYLKFRTNRKNRNLPWIPFKAQDLKRDDKGTFTFSGLKLKTWYSRTIPRMLR